MRRRWYDVAEEQGSLTAPEIAAILDERELPVTYETISSVGPGFDSNPGARRGRVAPGSFIYPIMLEVVHQTRSTFRRVRHH
jgi:hypothetical protein